MNLPTFPEDSVLKRHFDATVELKRQTWLQSPPSDSILNRHAASMDIQSLSRSAGSTKRATPTASMAASSSAARTPQSEVEEKGFFAWLLGLFTGKA
ncbi:MAG: hypothetical protein KME56_07735 [Candidatus Thiodiazotropha sp. (ex Ctena orbiculata)]|uniref:Uncharacterized protein n=1 Tax=Candidatus Thiodiazotropha taylori TaxID=2792791 RepID=A0A944QXD1_9GAMM|nr:hypothetical protein [Candidatus Thiodiazotropha taylori]MBT2991201.1 hypothetical protein [Candidatus Thiodiazotropha taylori]MBT2996505.1 hypothetical protein [Candidatus Thiodiazotropha taylori]MBT3000545.1 hypothetical protein [Candidatus Thiodiazotropha taylori]MBT3026765.1 hypothetical protein [Candidatus Thiodiazotropha taylori]